MSLQFLFPNWLWALSLIAIPIIIHLFNFRKYKIVYFTNVHLLKEVKKDTQSRTKLRELLILLARILLITFLVLAFAQPVLIDKEKQEQYSGLSDLTIIVDNSFSMSAEGRDGELLELAKLKAMDIVNAYPASTSVMILSTDISGQQAVFKSKEESYTSISQIKISPFTNSLNRVVRFFKSLDLQAETQHYLYVISDFQKNDYKPISSLDKNLKLFLVPLEVQQQRNVFIDTAYFQSPIHNLFADEQLIFRIRNLSDKDLIDYKVNLFINDSLKSVLNIDLKSKSSVLDTFNYKNIGVGTKKGRISISDFPVIFDNDLFFNYTIKKDLKVGIYSDTDFNIYLDAFFKNNTYYKSHYFDISNLNMSRWDNSDVIIINVNSVLSTGIQDKIEQHIQKGKPLVLFVNNWKENIDLWNTLGIYFLPSDSLSKPIAAINTNSELFQNSFSKMEGSADLPTLTTNKSIQGYNEWLVKDKAERVFVALKNEKSDNILIFSNSMDERNRSFYTHPIFIPLMYNFMSDAQKQPPYYLVNRQNVVYLSQNKPSVDRAYRVEGDEVQIIPEQYMVNSGVKIHLPSDIGAGYYSITYADKESGAFSMNYDRKESLLDFYSLDILKQNAENQNNIQLFEGSKITRASVEEAINYQKDLWYFSLLIALFFLFSEVALILFWRK